MMEYLVAMQSLKAVEQVEDYHYIDRLGPLEEDWLLLLHNLLQFNPYLRWSASECLNLSIFKSFRSEGME